MRPGLRRDGRDAEFAVWNRGDRSRVVCDGRACAHDGRRLSLLAAGASGYLLKRMSPKKLLDAIAEVRDGGSPMSASIARKVVESFHSRPGHADDSGELSQRERSVLNGLAEGLAYKQIADQLGVSIHTVRNYIRRIYEKLHVQTRTEAVAKFMRK